MTVGSYKRIAGSALVALLACYGTAAGAQSTADLDRRLTALERRLESGALIEMVNQLEVMRREVQNLRGDFEEMRRQIDDLRQRQRDLYVDVDTRLQALEEERPSPAPTDNRVLGDDGTIDAPPGAGERPPGNDTDPAGGAGTEGNREASAGSAPDNGSGPDMTADGDPRSAYREAFDTLKDGRYEDAARQFQGYLERYPDSQYADNARYWLGESYYVVREFDAAMTHFQGVLDDYPDSPKRADALLKIGFIEYEQGRLNQSRQTLRRVLEDYPDSTAANLAQQRLERIQNN